MHCLVFTDTDLYGLTKGKSYLANQRWRCSTCLRDRCYDVRCHPCVDLLGRTSHCSAWHMIIQYLGDNCIPIFHLGRYHNLRLRSCGAVKYDFRPIQRYIPPNQKFEYGYPYAVFVKLERCKPHKVARHLAICDYVA